MTAKSKKTSAKKTAAKKTERVNFSTMSSRESRQTMTIVSAEDNPRRPGTIGHANYNSMLKYLKANKNPVAADVIENTEYRIEDLNSDLGKGFVKVKEGAAKKAAKAEKTEATPKARKAAKTPKAKKTSEAAAVVTEATDVGGDHAVAE
jgi:hypothetical protein